jgi:hypothetical protein
MCEVAHSPQSQKNLLGKDFNGILRRLFLPDPENAIPIRAINPFFP